MLPLSCIVGSDDGEQFREFADGLGVGLHRPDQAVHADDVAGVGLGDVVLDDERTHGLPTFRGDTDQPADAVQGSGMLALGLGLGIGGGLLALQHLHGTLVERLLPFVGDGAVVPRTAIGGLVLRAMLAVRLLEARDEIHAGISP